MNNVTLIGRITKDLELRSTSNGKSVCEFNIAVNRIGEGTDFITCVIYGNQAENLCKYQDKGSQIAVSGSLRVDTYEKDGQRKYKTYVLTNNIEYLESKKATDKENLTVQEESIEIDPFASMGEQVEEDDGLELPF